jgi:flagellar hook assembly protein FlgD
MSKQSMSEAVLAELDEDTKAKLAAAETKVKAKKAADRKAKALADVPNEVIEAAQLVGQYLARKGVTTSSSGWTGRDVRGIPSLDGQGTIKVIYTKTRP